MTVAESIYLEKLETTWMGRWRQSHHRATPVLGALRSPEVGRLNECGSQLVAHGILSEFSGSTQEISVEFLTQGDWSVY